MLRSSYSSKNSVFLCTVMKDWQKVTMGFLSRQDSERSPSLWLKSSWDKLVLSKKKPSSEVSWEPAVPDACSDMQYCFLLHIFVNCGRVVLVGLAIDNWNKARMPLSQIWLVVRQVLCYCFETCGAVMLLGPAFSLQWCLPKQSLVSWLGMLSWFNRGGREWPQPELC